MANQIVKKASQVKRLAKKGLDKIDVEEVKSKIVDVKEKADDIREDLDDKIHELDRQLEEAIKDYNDQYTQMNDAGLNLYIQRTRAVDVINNVEELVNSIANKPQTFASDFTEINQAKKSFKDAEAFAVDELNTARKAAGNAGAGVAAGIAVVSMAPSAAMWVATTFGTASTGTAISTLSGIAAENAALAWLGGGALAAGGKGIAGGTALLAMAGPVGIGIAGASLLVSIVLFSKNRTKNRKAKNEEIESVKRNTEALKENTAKINHIFAETVTQRDELNNQFSRNMDLFGKDYNDFDNDDKTRLMTLINNTRTLSALFQKTIDAQ